MACVLGPFCWADTDIQECCRSRYLPVEYVNSAVRKLVRRSKGTFRLLSAFRLGDTGFAFAANCGRYLKVLEIPTSEVNDKIVEKFAESLANLTVLDISYCLKITHVGIEAVGKNCKSLIQLKRNMPPPELERFSSILKLDDREAMVVADTMPLLQDLQLGFGCFGDFGLYAILAENKCHSSKEET
ncbi:F-box protein FBW2-like [Durio zibethinus]|uniref:F-box protein FBW2-like n=1 Tax=Durio zibethinus TaxID=66656 RepID=A0A6P5Y0L9_DURZI|nr:F-box protein FBW2-like [Durio zibethinus]